MMANTMEDAPRSPAKEISSCWFIGHLAGESRANTAAGLAIKVKTAQWPEKAELFQATAGKGEQAEQEKNYYLR